MRGEKRKHPSLATNGRFCVVWDNYHYRATSIQQATFKLASRLSLPSEGCVIARHGLYSRTQRGPRSQTHTHTHTHKHILAGRQAHTHAHTHSFPLFFHCKVDFVMTPAAACNKTSFSASQIITQEIQLSNSHPSFHTNRRPHSLNLQVNWAAGKLQPAPVKFLGRRVRRQFGKLLQEEERK